MAESRDYQNQLSVLLQNLLKERIENKNGEERVPLQDLSNQLDTQVPHNANLPIHQESNKNEIPKLKTQGFKRAAFPKPKTTRAERLKALAIQQRIEIENKPPLKPLRRKKTPIPRTTETPAISAEIPRKQKIQDRSFASWSQDSENSSEKGTNRDEKNPQLSFQIHSPPSRSKTNLLQSNNLPASVLETVPEDESPETRERRRILDNMWTTRGVEINGNSI